MHAGSQRKIPSVHRVKLIFLLRTRRSALAASNGNAAIHAFPRQVVVALASRALFHPFHRLYLSFSAVAPLCCPLGAGAAVSWMVTWIVASDSV